MDGRFTGYTKVHPVTGATPHLVHIVTAGGQATLLCLTCETFQTVDSIAAGTAVVEKGAL